MIILWPKIRKLDFYYMPRISGVTKYCMMMTMVHEDLHVVSSMLALTFFKCNSPESKSGDDLS